MLLKLSKIYLYIWTHWDWTKRTTFTDIFKWIFLKENICILSKNSLQLTWTNDDQFRWHHMESVGHDKLIHYGDVIMGMMASQITSLTIVYSASKLRITGLCVVNSPGTGEFPAPMATYAENASIWWRHHEIISFLYINDLNSQIF